MKFEERLSELINEVDVPDELSPQNIAIMLKAKSNQSKMEAEHKNIKAAPSISAQRRTIIVRTVAASAACAVFAVGMWVYNEHRAAEEQLEAPISYEAVSPKSYDDLLDIITGITIGQDGNTEPDPERTIDETVTKPDVKETEPPCDFTDYNGENISEADIVKSDENYIYCLKDSTLFIISKETMEVVSKIESTLNPPIEIYIEDGKVILISKETEDIQVIDSSGEAAVTEASQAGNSQTASDVPANDADSLPPAENSSDGSDEAVSEGSEASPASLDAGESAIPAVGTVSRTNVIADIYDVSDPTNPVHSAAYKQNGSCTSSKIVDGVLYMVSAYTDYRVKPLDTQADLDSFVPAYYLDGEKFYIAAEDIIVPSNAADTDYTVVSAINFGGSDISATVKAVLGGGRYVYCSADTLYIAGVGKKDREYSVISSFDLSGGGLSYRSSCSVEGAVLGQQSMNEYDGMFRVAAKITDKDGKTSASVYVLDKSLTVVNSAGQLMPDGKISAVRFEKNYARIIDEESDEAVIVLDLSTNPPTLAQSVMSNSAYLYCYSDKLLFGAGKAQDGGIALTMYDSETGLAVNGTVIGDSSEMFSAALTDRRAVLIDEKNNFIGIPVYSHNEFGTKNSYYVFGYGDDGFVQKGVIEYVDVDDSMVFCRAEISGDTLYIIGNGRIVSARLSDLKVIGTFEY
ncbi:MAG: beta-propeller domain-containing protein [Oscillospiraceae bacterium]